MLCLEKFFSAVFHFIIFMFCHLTILCNFMSKKIKASDLLRGDILVGSLKVPVCCHFQRARRDVSFVYPSLDH